MNFLANRRMGKRVLDDINFERVSQYKKWGPQDHNDLKWLAIVTKKLDDASREATKCTSQNEKFVIERKQLLREELVQVAASTIAFIEAIDRRS